MHIWAIKMARTSLSVNGTVTVAISVPLTEVLHSNWMMETEKVSFLTHSFLIACFSWTILGHSFPWCCINGLLSEHVGSSAKICFLEELSMNNLTVISAQRWGEGFHHIITDTSPERICCVQKKRSSSRTLSITKTGNMQGYVVSLPAW